MLAEMQFKGAWRDYQARVLDEMDGQLADGRLHIVAAPGSGKTVLGLEAMRRLGRPALILAPSLTIRDQWRERLFPLFLDDPAAWSACISTDLAAPATMTLATYQALHAVHAGGAERFDALVAALAAAGPVTLIVDEAHHLRREWWVALLALRDRLAGAYLIALTATPPYDAPFAEWSRYEALCGPIDSEISVPELVRNGDLCPHQDHVHISRPPHDEEQRLLARRAAIEALAAGVFADAALIDCVAAHPWLTAPETHEEELLERPEYATAMMMALRAAGRGIPPAATELLGVQDADLPAFTSVWLERLFDGLLYEPRSKTELGDERWTALHRTLDRLGLIENRRVSLGESKAMFAAAAGSLAKLDSIVAIARAQLDSLGAELRLVILSDYVRADDLPEHPDDPFVPAKLGVVPIFETLRRAGVATETLAILTGTLVVLPAPAIPGLAAEAAAAGLDPALLRCRPLPGCPGHVAVDAAGAADRGLVPLMTRLFQHGTIRVLVGTHALLGEGWDAPTINSLVMASNAGSYMLSNQIRGRAIRIDPAAPGKVAAIWHLATIHPGLADDQPAGDADLLARRFDTFEGIDNGASDRIESGIDRLRLDLAGVPAVQNAASLAHARDPRRSGGEVAGVGGRSGVAGPCPPRGGAQLRAAHPRLAGHAAGVDRLRPAWRGALGGGRDPPLHVRRRTHDGAARLLRPDLALLAAQARARRPAVVAQRHARAQPRADRPGTCRRLAPSRRAGRRSSPRDRRPAGAERALRGRHYRRDARAGAPVPRCAGRTARAGAEPALPARARKPPLALPSRRLSCSPHHPGGAQGVRRVFPATVAAVDRPIAPRLHAQRRGPPPAAEGAGPLLRRRHAALLRAAVGLDVRRRWPQGMPIDGELRERELGPTER